VLNLDSAVLIAPAGKRNRVALGLYRARLDDLYMTRAVLIGGLFANGLSVQRNVRLSGVQARSRDALRLELGPDTKAGFAASLAGADVGGAIYLFSEALATDPPRLDGGLDLSRATCATVRARAADLAGLRLSLDHLRYDRLQGASIPEWLTVLEQADEVGTQPYRHLAAYAESAGQFEEARDVRIALQRRIDREPRAPRSRALRRAIFRISVAYGYRPGRAVLWLSGVCLLAVAVLIAFDDFMVRAGEGEAQRGFGSPSDASLFALDSLIPFARLGVSDGWSADPEGLAQIVAVSAFVLLKGAAWALAALALAATTGLVRRE
jgi:hypothetical protein